MVNMYAISKIKKKTRKHSWKGNMKEMEEGTNGHGGGWSRHLMGGNNQDKC